MDEYLVLRAYLTSLGIGLLIGLERERAEAQAAGLRSFALVALSGTTAAAIAEHSGAPWVIAAALLALVAFAVASYLRDPRRAADPGITTAVALVLCYLLGALCWYGHLEVAVGIGVATTALLYFKPELHGFSRRISGTEMRAILQFAAVAFLLLPLLPDRAYGPWQAINPFRIGLLVALISGLSLAGYVALKLLASRHAVVAVGLLGGAVSSTATTLAFSRRARAGEVPPATAALVVTLANLTVLVRLGVLAAAAAPRLLPALLPVLGAALVAGLLLPLYHWRRLPAGAPAQAPEVRNPAELSSAFGFALLFAAVLLATAGVTELLGVHGLYAVAALSGLTDVDAISLSAMQLQRQARIGESTAVAAICIAYAANLLFKLGVVAVIGGRAMALSVGAGFACVLCGLLIAAAALL